MTTSPLTDQEQFQCLNLLDTLSDLFTVGTVETFTREDILVIIDGLRSNTELFDPLVVVAQQIATQESEW